MKRDRTKTYRELQKAKERIQKLKQEKDRYKKRYHRIKTLKTGKSTPSPNSKVNDFLNKRVVLPDIRRQLLIGEALRSQISENARLQESHKEKQCYRKILSGGILKKYRLQGQIQDIIPYKQNKKLQSSNKILVHERKDRNNILSNDVKAKIRTFFERDDISRMCPGKKDFRRKGTIRKQKRLLLKTLKESYSKYMQCAREKMSYTTFIKGKPFWVVPPVKSDRETCLCLKHENFRLLSTRMNALNMLVETKIADITTKNPLEIKIMNPEEITEFYQWRSHNEERTINDTKKIIRITSKQLIRATKQDLAGNFYEQLPGFKQHVRNITHQFTELHNKKNNLSENELILQVDFSENYSTKLHSEIQSMHFGANKKQLSIHTGVMYHKKEDVLKTESFATVSENLDHQCHGVWGHLTPILKDFAEKNPGVDTIHFFSDGPTSQYKNRLNIYLLTTLLPKIIKNLKYSTWNYSEASHGKGPMDGVGGTLKRQADNFVLRGGDIVSASDFVTLFIDSKIKVLLVKSQAIQEVKNCVPERVKKIPKITKLHQVTWKIDTGFLYLRELTCFECLEVCNHYSVGTGSIRCNLAIDVIPQVFGEDKNNIGIDDWVAVIYEEKWFPGLVKSSENIQLEITFMARSGRNKFYWPKVADIQTVLMNDILCRLNSAPQPVSTTRPNIFFIPNFKDLDDLL